MATTHSLENLKHYHNEAIQFFGSELMLLKEAVLRLQMNGYQKLRFF